MLSGLTPAEAYAFGAGLVHFTLALVFWYGRRFRPDWGLSWLALSYGASALVNMPGLLPSGAARQPLTPGFFVVLVLGVSALAALVAGVRQFIGRGRRPALSFALAFVGFVAASSLLRVLGFKDLGGQMAASALFVYLAVLCAGALRQVAGIGNRLALASMLVYPVMVLSALGLGMDTTALNLWAAVPYALVGLGLVVAALGRYQVELDAELERRERAEAQLRRLNASLEERIEARTVELRDMVEGLESFNRMVSHDLRGPLGGLSGLSALAGQALAEGDTPRAQRMLELMRSETGRLVELVSDLLMLARVSHADIELRPTALDGVLDEALQVLALSHGAELVRAIAREPLPEAQADGRLIRQVFVNLLSNALKFSAGQPGLRVRVRGGRDSREVVVEVRDHGVGFPEARAAELFQPFRRLHGDAYAGTGIGPATVRASSSACRREPERRRPVGREHEAPRDRSHAVTDHAPYSGQRRPWRHLRGAPCGNDEHGPSPQDPPGRRPPRGGR